MEIEIKLYTSTTRKASNFLITTLEAREQSWGTRTSKHPYRVDLYLCIAVIIHSYAGFSFFLSVFSFPAPSLPTSFLLGIIFQIACSQILVSCFTLSTEVDRVHLLTRDYVTLLHQILNFYNSIKLSLFAWNCPLFSKIYFIWVLRILDTSIIIFQSAFSNLSSLVFFCPYF